MRKMGSSPRTLVARDSTKARRVRRRQGVIERRESTREDGECQGDK